MKSYDTVPRMWKKLAIGVLMIFAIIGFVLVGGFFAVQYGWTNTKGIIDTQRAHFLAQKTGSKKEQPVWTETDSWNLFSTAVVRDAGLVSHIGEMVGVSPRLIIAEVAAEQMRLFESEREVFKRFFAPLKILGSQTQFSWGIGGIKEQTAQTVELNLKDPTSPFYPGVEYEHLLDFKTSDIGSERFERIVHERDHYYAYLYTALYLKEIETQWKNAGFPIDKKIGALSTLYNIGFAHSKPKANPEIGGAELTIENYKGSFGGFAEDFYYSDELLTEFPR